MNKCTCTAYNGGPCYNCINGAHNLCNDCDSNGIYEDALERIAQLEKEKAELVGALQIIAQLKGHSDKVACLASIQGAAELAQQALQGKGDWVAVPVVDCPDCDNVGYTVEVNLRTEEPEQCQCEFCYTVPNSRFNVENLITAANKGEGG